MIVFVPYILLLISYWEMGNTASLQEGLVGHWPFEQTAGNSIQDISGHGQAGITFGSPTITDGVIGEKALFLDGKNDYIQLHRSDEPASLLREIQTGSMSLWFNASTIPDGKAISPIVYYGSQDGCSNMFDASNQGFVVELAHGGVYPNSRGIFYTVFSNDCELPSLCFDSHSDPHLSDQQGIIRTNIWYHFVVVVGENYNRGYLNGKKLDYRYYNFGSPSASQFFAAARKHERFWLGKGYWNYGSEVYFHGAIDDFRVYDRPLSDSEVQALYAMKK